LTACPRRNRLVLATLCSREGLVERHTLCVNESNVVHRVKVFVPVGLAQDVVALHHDNGGEGGDALELDKLLIGRIIHVD
jgi:hypothetical protein